LGTLDIDKQLLALFSHPRFAILEVKVNLEANEGSAGMQNTEDLGLGNCLQTLLSIADRQHSLKKCYQAV